MITNININKKYDEKEVETLVNKYNNLKSRLDKTNIAVISIVATHNLDIKVADFLEMLVDENNKLLNTK